MSLSGLSISLLLVAGLLTFVYALWCCVRIYEPRSFAHGIGANAVEEIDDAVQAEREVEEHYRQLTFSYSRAISRFATAYSAVKAIFCNALWASVTAIVFFSFVAIRQLLPSYPASFDAVVVLRGKNKYKQD